MEKEIKQTRNFGFILSSIIFFLIALNYWKAAEFGLFSTIFSIFSATLLSLAIFSPKLLIPIEKAWTILGEKMSIVMTFVIMLFVFYFIMAPIGLIRRIFGKDSLELKPDNRATTYWKSTISDGSEKRYFKPF